MRVFSSPVEVMSRDPNPWRLGALTGGPPVSFHVNCSFHRSNSSITSHETRTWPVPLDKAPYLIALVASSWRHSVKFNDVLAETQTVEPLTTKRSSCFAANGFTARPTTSRRDARCQFSDASS